MALIINESKETIIKIFDYLNLKYNFQPNIMSMEFDRGPYKAVIHKYPNRKIFPCFFHLIQRYALHLPELKYKKNTLKKIGKIKIKKS